MKKTRSVFGNLKKRFGSERFHLKEMEYLKGGDAGGGQGGTGGDWDPNG